MDLKNRGILLNNMNGLLLIGIWILALFFFIGGVTKLSLSEADYEEMKISYDMVYLAQRDRSDLMIVIESRKKTYYIYKDLVSTESKMREALHALEHSPTVTLWCEKENNYVGGFKTDKLTIPLKHGLEVEHEDGKWALCFSAFFFVAGIGFYLFMKWYFKENWVDGTIPQHNNDEILRLDLIEDRGSSMTPTSNSDDIIKLDLK